jgi:hypothetical protein
MIEMLIALAAGIGGYVLATDFVRHRLRFVDAVQAAWAPFAAGIVAAVILLPLTVLPLVSGFTAIVFGVGAGLGTAKGARFIRRADSELRRLSP